MPPEQVKKGLDAFRNPSKWPDWNSNAKSMLATKPETIDEGDHLAIFQVIKGSLIETKWLVNSIREGDGFCEIELSVARRQRLGARMREEAGRLESPACRISLPR